MGAPNPKARKRAVRPTGRLADLAATNKVETTLLGDIQKHLLHKSTQPTDRRQDILHPSEMAKADWCPRQSYYRLAGATPSEPQAKKFSFQLEGIFAEGHEIHRKWQQWLTDMGILYGKWKCDLCGFHQHGTGPFDCEHCGQRKAYHEVPLSAEEKYLIAGHEDGAVESINALVEIKSIGIGSLRFEEPQLLRKYQVETTDGRKIYDMDALWKGLRRPLSSHIRQTAIYLALCQEMGLPFDKVVFLYEFKANQAVKEFTVKYNPAIAEPLLDQALDVKYALAQGRPVPRPPHTGLDTKVCKECPFKTLCWGADATGAETSSPSDDVDLGPTDAVGTSGERPAGEGASSPAEAGGTSPRTAGRPYRTPRQRTDEPVRRPDRVDGVHGDAARSGGSGRTISIRRPRPA